MKTKLTILLWLLASGFCFAGLQTINIYSPLGTNTTPMNGTISIPGVITNAPFTIVSNLITGDPQSLAWTKANNNWAYQQSEIQSNAAAIGSGLGYGTGGGIGTNTGNLFVTNPLTLFNPNPYYQIIGIIPLPGQPGDPLGTNCGQYVVDLAIGPNWFTNLCGDLIFIANTVFSPTNATHVIQSISMNYGVAGGITFTNNGTFQFYVGNSSIITPIYDFTNSLGQSHSYTLVVSGAGVSGANQTYIYNSGANQFIGQTDSSFRIYPIYANNWGGGSYQWVWCLNQSGTQLYEASGCSGFALNTFCTPFGSFSGAYNPAPTITDVPRYTTNTCWAMFQTNWLFCGATNVAFSNSPPGIFVTGNYTTFFSVTNVAAFPTSDQTATANDGISQATFNTAVVGFGFNASNNLTFIVFPPGSATNGPPAWTPPFGAVPPYIVVQIGPDTKYLVGSEGWCSLLARQGANFLQYNLSVDAGGNATVHMASLTTTGSTNILVVKYSPWTSSDWTTTLPTWGPLMILNPPFTFY